MPHEYIEINTDAITVPDEHTNLITARANAARSFSINDGELSIAVIANNRIDQVKVCVESLINHTHMPYKLLLIDSGSDPEVCDYYKSVNYPDKKIIRLTKNINGNYAFWTAMHYMQSRFNAIVPNDVVITHNAIDNLYKCISSADDIGWVTPVSSNVSNLQQVNLLFNTPEEMHAKAALYNQSNPLRWYERLALMPSVMMYRKECVDIVGGFDYGFMHDFADDDISRRFHRAGYKTILCADTWVHHNHVYVMSHEKKAKFMQRLYHGRAAYQKKYHGLDAWNDTRVIERGLIGLVQRPSKIKPVSILGIDVRMGAPILELRNMLRGFGITETESRGFTTNAKYYTDLLSICDDVKCDRIDYIHDHYEKASFDYIIVGETVNLYQDYFELIKSLCVMLKQDGTLLIKLHGIHKQDSIRYILGDSTSSQAAPPINLTAESISKHLTELGCTVSPSLLAYGSAISQTEKHNATRLLDSLPINDERQEALSRLLSLEYLFAAKMQ